MKSTRVIRILVSCLLAAVVAGCSLPGMNKVLPDRKVEYKASRQAENDLEIPPDLTSSSINDEMAIPGIIGGGDGNASLAQLEQRTPPAGSSTATARREVLPRIENIDVMRDGDQRWLMIRSDPEEVWFRVEEFWQQNGVLLQQQDPTTGVMVTDWLQNLADIKSDFVTDAFRSFVPGLYTASTRDQFRVRIEEGPVAGTTELYLTHRGMQESIVQDVRGEVDHTVWNPRPTDHFLEAEMLRRLMVSLGVSEQQAERSLASNQGQRQPRSRLVKSGEQISLTIDEGFERAWRLTGVALDRVGFAVEDRDRSGGVYYVRYDDPMRGTEKQGWLSKLAFWRGEDDNIDTENQYQVSLAGEENVTRVVIRNQAGVEEHSDTAQRILTLLNEQIR